MKIRFGMLISLAIFLVSQHKPCAAEGPKAVHAKANPAWSQPYEVQDNKRTAQLILRTPYYALEHDRRKGGTISAIQISGGTKSNLLQVPLHAFVRDEQNGVFSDINDNRPKVERSRDGQVEVVEVRARLVEASGESCGIETHTRYEYHWGYVKVHREFRAKSNAAMKIREICPISGTISATMTDYGYREGLSEQDGAPAFSFGSCKWGNTSQPVSAKYVPRYLMLASPGVEGFEWFAGSNLDQWEAPFDSRRGLGRFRLEKATSGKGCECSISPFCDEDQPKPMAERLAFDFYIGVPIKPAHALSPWMHTSFNRNQGSWVGAEQIKQWAAQGIQTIHCHNDGDYADDGLFWRDGSYPPYPKKDMVRYDEVISGAHAAGIRVATYFSNKELHPSTPEFQQNGKEWARQNAKGEMIHNFFRGTNEFGAQMCLRSGWLKFLEFSIDRVLKHHALDGVYYDWNVALYCCNPLHEGKAAGASASGHWDIDQLLQLMEWTRQRVGPNGMIIVHNTTTPMFAMENFADYVVANEWGYGKWGKEGAELNKLPLEWSLVEARPRGVISYGQIEDNTDRRLHRLFALEALLSGVTPWPASPETFELYKALQPIGDLTDYHFSDWRDPAVKLENRHCASAIYSKPGEAWVLIGNTSQSQQQVPFQLQIAKLPSPLPKLTQATVSKTPFKEFSELDPNAVLKSGIAVVVPANGVVLVHLKESISP